MPALKLLLLEDKPDDEKLIIREFRKSGYEITYKRTQAAQEFRELINKEDWDIIISDYHLPSFNGIEALKILKENFIDIPFIIVSGQIGEVMAVRAMREGADDYVMKDNLHRLVPASERAIKEAANRLERRRAEKSLKEIRKRMEAIITSAMDAIISIDSDFKIVMMNQSAVNLFGYQEVEVIGKEVYLLFPSHIRDQHIRFMEIFGKSTKENQMMNMTRTIYGLRKNGDEFPCEASISKVQVAGKKYYTLILRDISLRLEAELQEKQLNAELVRQNEQLQQFGYMASHNIRGPVASILGLIELYKNKPMQSSLSPEDIILNLEKTVQKLDQVIRDMNTILEYKAQINTLKEDVNLTEVLENVQSELITFIVNSNATIKADFAQVNQLYSIKTYIHSIFYNMISNAIKYQDYNRAPVIEIKAAIAKKFHRNWVLITFKDNGIGIDLSKNREKLFGLYKRFHQHVQGKGLGLHLVKTQIDTLNGHIEVESEVRKGTTFKIYHKLN